MRFILNPRKKLTAMLLIMLTVVMLLPACVSRKKTLLYQRMPKDTLIYVHPPADYTVQKSDVLYIRVQSADEKAAAFINGSVTQQNSGNFSQSEQYLYFTGYEVSPRGTIGLPYLDSIRVEGLTTDKIAALLTDSLREYIIDPLVSVKLANFRVCVFGEATNPGTFVFYHARPSIFDALALARPTEFANAKSVVITRQRPGNTVSVERVDLTGAGILISEYYYLQPNDQIYLEPLKIKKYGFSNFPYAIFLSTISTIVLIYSLFK